MCKGGEVEPRESGDRAVDGSVASAVAIAAGARPTPAAAGSSPRCGGAAALRRRGPRGAGARDARDARRARGARDAPARRRLGRSGVDAAAWLLARSARRPAPAGRGRFARPFALAVAAALAATDNAAAVLCDEDAVICWKVVNGAKQPVVACARLRWHASRSFEAREGVVAPLADALIAKRDCAFLDASSAADDALDADLAGLSADALSEAAAKKKRSLLADVVGSRPALWLVAEADEGAAREELRKGATRRSRLLLASMPFALPFRARVRLFQEKVCPDGQSNARAEEIRFFDASSPRPTDKTIVRVRRSHVLDDGLDRIAGLSPAALKGRLSVAFVDDWGRAEAGIDAGGLFKEFWTELSGAAFSMDFGLFKTTAHDGLLFRTRFAFALREGITIQPRFTRSFLSFVRGDFNYVTLLEDLKSLDPDLHRNLKFLQLYDGDVADLGLDFSVSFDRFGECVTANLIPNGADVEVTRANRHAYVAKFHMVDRLDAQSRAFVGGLGDVVDLALLRRFPEPELQLLISGAEDAVDVDDLKAHARYGGACPATST
ncbi:ubiquitin-protein transferase [Aureococcus anophagefferens]|nr:ubiquitin-protein transferase [Aureococcus anophagefferens]